MIRVPRRSPAPLVLAVLVALGSAAAAAPTDAQPRNEIGVLLGGAVSDGDLEGGKYGVGSLGPVYGVRGGHLFGSRWLWFADATVALFPTDLASGKAERVAIRTGVDLLLGKRSKRSWFVSGGAGWGQLDYRSESLDFDRPLGSLGVGQRIALRNGLLFRWELRGEALLGNRGLRGDGVQNGELLVGWAIPLGGGASGRDADRDGVPDRRDRCAFTPAGARVDERGCAMDSDGDGVSDGTDRCPDTPRGARTSADGCPVDRDGDGVPDGLDACADTPRGSVVDRLGCGLDADGDGVADGVDRCPGTPAGARVDERGCSADSDGDGVPDNLDRCASTPRGVAVDSKGCSADSDGDGVRDDVDRCPATPIGGRVGRDGCPPLTSEVASLLEGRSALVLEGARFAVGSAVLDEEAERVLDRVAAGLRQRSDARIVIAGHTDSTGSADANVELSRRRAEAVRGFLVSAGVDASRLTATAHGAASPVADNATESGRARNRRVELSLAR